MNFGTPKSLIHLQNADVCRLSVFNSPQTIKGICYFASV